MIYLITVVLILLVYYCLKINCECKVCGTKDNIYLIDGWYFCKECDPFNKAVESYKRTMSKKQALNLLISNNNYIQQKIKTGQTCSCNACYLCAYQILKKLV